MSVLDLELTFPINMEAAGDLPFDATEIGDT